MIILFFVFQGCAHTIKCLAYYERPDEEEFPSKAEFKRAVPPIVLLQWAPKDLCTNLKSTKNSKISIFL